MFRRKQDTCAHSGCDEKPVGTLQDHFTVAGVTGVAFYRQCAEHALAWEKAPTTGHAYTWKPDECDHVWKMDDKGISRCVRCYNPRPPKHEREKFRRKPYDGMIW